ncbi:MAG: 2-oxoglutarate oxidoreductase [Saprospirales bacterium]|nr:2-oxoglutarate oxidoreductase [Saprospirales bacterium]MBK8490168.1 2-oxoglutarate oxidoreductase [Saprospirales bacterium]
MYGLKLDYCAVDVPDKYYSQSDYEKGTARWCPGCGDHSVLSAVQRLCQEKQLAPEKTVFVSGIGCSSRFPHYMSTYGFHGLHGRAFPVAEGVKFRRPDLDVFVVTGDGDCCSIGAGHWIHSIRYNMNITVLLFDNQIYGMTKKQTSPTSPIGTMSNTHPHGSVLPPINPIQTTLGVSNVSFVAQTADWMPGHLYATIKAAHEHQGFSFVKVMMRCPKFMQEQAKALVADREHITMLTHENGIQVDEATAAIFSHKKEHDPSDISKARQYSEDPDMYYLGLYYQDKTAPRYDLYGAHNMGFSAEQKLQALNAELDRYAL